MLLVVSQTLQAGVRGALWTISGDLLANAVQIAAVSLAMSVIFPIVDEFGVWLKYGGAAFLAVSGLRGIFSTERPVEPVPVSAAVPFFTGFGVSISNPVAVLFFALWLPVFVSDKGPALPQFATLGAIALVLDGVSLIVHMTVACKIGKCLQRKATGTATARAGGVLRLIAAAILATAM